MSFSSLPMSTAETTTANDGTKETAESSSPSSNDIPKNLPSDCGMDYIPLATMLATGDFEKADQVRFILETIRDIIWGFCYRQESLFGCCLELANSHFFIHSSHVIH